MSLFSFIAVLLNFRKYWSIFLFSNVVISASMGFVLYLCQDLKPNV